MVINVLPRISKIILPTLLCCIWSSQTQAIDDASFYQNKVEGIAWLLEHQNGDGSWGENGAKVAATSEVLQLLRNNNVQHSPHYARALSWLANKKTNSTDYLARKIIALETAGLNTAQMGLVDELLLRRNSFGSWGTYEAEHPSIIDSSLAFQSLYISSHTIKTAESTAFSNTVLYARQANNMGFPHLGWFVGRGLSPQIAPTSFALKGLADLKRHGVDRRSYMTLAANWLISKQQTNGSFADDNEFNTSTLQTALAYTGLQATESVNANVSGRDSALTDAQNFLFTQQQANGSWHNDSYQTAIVLNTLSNTSFIDTDNDGIPDDVELILGSNVAVADSIDYVQGNGIRTVFTISSLLTEIIINQAYTYTFSLTGGEGAVTWTPASMPEGLTFNNGVISGTPTQEGSFNFVLEVTDSKGNVALSSGRINVIGQDDIDVDTDNDGFPSSWEILNGFDPLNVNDEALAATYAATHDTDGDGFDDAYELANGLELYSVNNGNLDTDEDGLTDNQEYALGTSLNNPDSDNDTMPDGWEVVYNFNPLNASDANLDKDSDGLINRNEYLYNAHPNKEDTDNDKVLDLVEVNFGLLANNYSDTDNDGMPNDWETVHNLSLGIASDANEDADNDALTNLEEFIINTNPQDDDTDNDGTNDGDEVAVNRNPLMNEPAVFVAIIHNLLL